jgi:hypothetical protein
LPTLLVCGFGCLVETVWEDERRIVGFFDEHL